MGTSNSLQPVVADSPAKAGTARPAGETTADAWPATTRRSLALMVNGGRHETAAGPETPLLYVLRNELGLTGPKFGCGLGQCGACTVHLDGRVVASCVTPVVAAVGHAVRTIEGLGTIDGPDPLQRAFIDEQAAQCGYCINGMIMAAAALLAHTPAPTDQEIRASLAGNLCRCGTHMRILRAIHRAAGRAEAIR
jgi:nicotinate dehydrogenase subunit A